MSILALVATAAMFIVVSAEERSESFDHDPQWDGRNNRTQLFNARPVVQDFGFIQTNHAHGAELGEVGGLITPAAEPAYYAKVIAAKSFDDRLTASGVFLATGRQFHVLLGFFVYPAYRVGLDKIGWADGIGRPHIYPNGEAHDWKLDYDPVDGEGRGTITFSLENHSVRLVLADGIRESSAEFDRFGFVTTWIDGNGQHGYLDDLTYTWKQ